MTPTFSQPAAAQSAAQSTDRTILEAALEVFAERGYAAATTREIASMGSPSRAVSSSRVQGSRPCT